MKILVTGGTGFLGTHVVERLLRDGHEVRVLARQALSKPSFQGANFQLGDLRDPSAVRDALQGVEVLYHLAGQVSFRPADGRAMFQLHVDCTRELLRAAREAGIRRVVLASTSGTVCVSKTDRIGNETNDYPIPVVGRWPYYLSKIYEEKLALEFCKRHGIALVVMNPSLLMGPGDERLSSTWTVARFLNGEIPSMPGGGLSLVDVRDAADAFVAALTQGELQGRHLLGVNLSFREFFQRLERLTGVAAPRLRLPSGLNVFGSRLLEKLARMQGKAPALDPQEVEVGEHFFYVDASKAKRLLAFNPRDLHETLFDTVKDYQSRIPPGHAPGTRGRLPRAA